MYVMLNITFESSPAYAMTWRQKFIHSSAPTSTSSPSPPLSFQAPLLSQASMATNSNHNSDDDEAEEFDPSIPKEVDDEDVESETMSDGNKEALDDILDGEENIVYDPEELEAINQGEDLYNGDFEQYAHHSHHNTTYIFSFPSYQTLVSEEYYI